MEVRYTSDWELLVYSHGWWLTLEEDARVCDMVDAIMQGDYD